MRIVDWVYPSNYNPNGIFPSRKEMKEILSKFEYERMNTYLGGDMDKYNKICTDECNQTLKEHQDDLNSTIQTKIATYAQNSPNLYTSTWTTTYTTNTTNTANTTSPNTISNIQYTPVSNTKYDILNHRLNVEHEEDWEGKIKNIPSISFPSSWNVKIIPPYGGLMARFIVTIPEHDKVSISVYYDIDNRIGYFQDENGNPAPYWEIFPYEYSYMSGGIHGETYRVFGQDTKQLVERIKTAIQNQVLYYNSIDAKNG